MFLSLVQNAKIVKDFKYSITMLVLVSVLLEHIKLQTIPVSTVVLADNIMVQLV
jgi:hypothetical protein